MADQNTTELREKIAALAIARYGSNTPENKKKLFMSYDLDKDDRLTPEELDAMLADAGVGNSITRMPPFGGCGWVCEIFKKVDQSPTDGKLSWDEYLAASSVDEAPAGGTAKVPYDPLGALGASMDKSKAPPPVIAAGAPASSGSSPATRFVIGAAAGAVLGLLLRQ